jgi:hypothetical protein
MISLQGYEVYWREGCRSVALKPGINWCRMEFLAREMAVEGKVMAHQWEIDFLVLSPLTQ